jgi:hypothetical protein
MLPSNGAVKVDAVKSPISCPMYTRTAHCSNKNAALHVQYRRSFWAGNESHSSAERKWKAGLETGPGPVRNRMKRTHPRALVIVESFGAVPSKRRVT